MELLKKSFKLYGLLIVASFMCFMLVISFNMIGTAFLTREIGYTAYGTKADDEEPTKLYEYYFEDGEDTKKQEYVDKGYKVSEISIRSQVDKKSGMIWDIVTQIFLIFMAGVFVYNNLWNVGHKDISAVRHTEQNEDKLKGLKIGAITILPSFILLTVLTIGKLTFAKNISIALYALLNAYLYEGILLVSGGGGLFSQLAIWQIVCYYAMLLFVPLIAHVAYTLGYKDILVSEKLTYKKNQEFT